jgi:hypothetical protein
MSITINSIINEEYIYPLKKLKLSSSEQIDINSLLKFDSIKKSISEKKVFENRFGKSIKNISGYFCKRNELNKFLVEKLTKTTFYQDYLPYLDKIFNTKSIDEVIKYIYIEYFITTDLFNLRLINREELNTLLAFGSSKEDFIKNSNLLITNKQSFELKKENISDFLVGRKINLKQEVVSLFGELGILLIEIPQFYRLESLISFLEEIRDLKNKLEIEKFSFKLRFKKLKHFKKDGMYIVNEKTIIVDPRKPKAFIHELGHYIFEEKINITLPEIERVNIEVNGYQKSKFEDYSIESETFAYSFEKVIQN